MNDSFITCNETYFRHFYSFDHKKIKNNTFRYILKPVGGDQMPFGSSGSKNMSGLKMQSHNTQLPNAVGATLGRV